MNAKHKFYRINYQIPSPRLLLLDEEGKKIGIVSKIEALQKAKERGIDLVEIAAKADPPVAKLIDFKKFKYQEAKREREAKRNQKNVGVKEVRLRPFIGQHDFDTRLARAKAFLAEGNQVKINVLFKGREITKRDFGFSVIRRFIAQMPESRVVREPKLLGRVIEAMLVKAK